MGWGYTKRITNVSVGAAQVQRDWQPDGDRFGKLFIAIWNDDATDAITFFVDFSEDGLVADTSARVTVTVTAAMVFYGWIIADLPYRYVRVSAQSEKAGQAVIAGRYALKGQEWTL